MLKKLLYPLILCLVLSAGCNPGVFIEDYVAIQASENEFVIPDTGDTINISINKEDWIINSVGLMDSIGTNYMGHVRENGEIRRSVRMELNGLGKIWKDYIFGGFSIIRDSYDSLTVIMEPNFTYQERYLYIVLTTELETLVIKIEQKPSQGFVVDKIEWKNEGMIAYVSNIANANNFDRVISIDEHLFWNGERTNRYFMFDILNKDFIELPIPDAYPTDEKLTFSGETIKLDPYSTEYTIEIPQTKWTVHRFQEYDTSFDIHLKHVADDNIKVCFRSGFRSKAPIFDD